MNDVIVKNLLAAMDSIRTIQDLDKEMILNLTERISQLEARIRELEKEQKQ